MRKCPKCGFEIHPMWRPRRSRVFCDYVKTETLQYNDPKLYKKIIESQPKPYYDGHFVYHVTRTGLNVELIEKYLYDYMGWGSEPQERAERGFDRKLDEFVVDKKG